MPTPEPIEILHLAAAPQAGWQPVRIVHPSEALVICWKPSFMTEAGSLRGRCYRAAWRLMLAILLSWPASTGRLLECTRAAE